MGIDENNRINFVSFDAKSLDLQKKAVAHLKSDLVDKVKRGLLSRYLYKYRTIEECKDILKNHHLHFSTIQELRDPFEGRAKIFCSDVEKVKKRFLKRTQLPYYSGMPPELVDYAKETILKLSDSKFIELQIQTVQYMFDSCGVFCMTGRRDDVCMWAYYADSHKGVCMKLDLLAQPLLFCPISHVGYDRSYHVADISEHPSDVFFRSVMLKKAALWAYEDEYRTVATHFAGDYPFDNPDLISEITFGYYCPEVDKKAIRQLAADEGYCNIRYSNITLDPKQYHLIVKPE